MLVRLDARQQYSVLMIPQLLCICEVVIESKPFKGENPLFVVGTAAHTKAQRPGPTHILYQYMVNINILY